jgi:hypothetical protein
MQMRYRHKQALWHRVKQALMKKWQWPHHPNVESQRFFSSTNDAPNNLEITKNTFQNSFNPQKLLF